MTLGKVLDVSGADGFSFVLDWFGFFFCHIACLRDTAFSPPLWISRGRQSALLSASASMCPSFQLQIITPSGSKSRGEEKTQQDHWFGSRYVSVCALSSARGSVRPRRAASTAPTSCQDTSMISMLPEKLDCFPILPSSSRDRLSEMPSSNSI